MTPSDPDVSLIAHVIQLAVAPVFLLTGVGALLSVMTNRLGRVIDRAETPARDHGGDDLADIRLHNRRLSTIDQVGLGPDWIYADDFMSLLGKTSCGDRTHIT